MAFDAPINSSNGREPHISFPTPPIRDTGNPMSTRNTAQWEALPTGYLNAVTEFATMESVDRAEDNTESIVCPLWVTNDRRFRSRHYHAWDRPCSLCGRKVVVSDEVKRHLDSHSAAVIVCEQCALIWSSRSEIRPLQEPKPKAAENMGVCTTCQVLNEREAAAAREWARFGNSSDAPGARAAYRKWAHLSNARSRHRFKAHADEPRGRE